MSRQEQHLGKMMGPGWGQQAERREDFRIDHRGRNDSVTVRGRKEEEDSDPQVSGLNNWAGTGAARRWRHLSGRLSVDLFWMCLSTSRT